MNHSFNVEVAEKYGIEKAVLLENFYFWVKKNKANKKNIHNGRAYTFNTAEAFHEYFPYIDSRKIARLLREMETDGLLISGQFNRFDRTKSYTLSDYAMTFFESSNIQKNAHSNIQKFDNPKAENLTIKDTEFEHCLNTDINTDINTDDDDNSESLENLPPPPPFLSEPRENYSKMVFEKFKNAGLPCQNGDFFRFQSCDFRLARQKLEGYHSDDILAAIDNYIAELKNPDSYVNQEYSFDNFIGTKTFSKCLPSNYRPQNFKIFASKIPKAEEQAERHFYEKCLKCGVKMMEWKNPLQKYKCDSCGSTFSWEEVDNATEHYIVP
ncbi:MAG: hypothetical protein IJ630_03565 [Treponema sp.]|nr:hypothetical protein [Treponema sp.]